MSATLATCSIDALSDAIEAWRPAAIVSCFSPKHPVGRWPGGPHLRLAFHDVEAPRVRVRAGNGFMVGPHSGHLAAFRQFMAQGHASVLIQCTAGLSRSPAFALIAMSDAGGDVKDACAVVREAIPAAAPNRLLLSIADSRLLAAAGAAFDFTTRTAIGASGERTGLRVLPSPKTNTGSLGANHSQPRTSLGGL